MHEVKGWVQFTTKLNVWLEAPTEVREPGGGGGGSILGVRLIVIFEKVYTHRVRKELEKGTIALY